MTAPDTKDRGPLRVAYVLSEYPNLTQTFVEREVHAVRAAGVHVEPMSLRMSALDATGVIFPTLSGGIAALTRAVRRNRAAVWHLLRACVSGSRPWNLRPRVVNVVILFKSIELAEVARRRKITHIHGHFIWGGGTAAWMIAKLLDIPFSVTVHAFDIYDQRVGDNLLTRKLDDAAFIVSVSAFNVAELVRRKSEWGRKSHVVRCGIDVSQITPRPYRRSRTIVSEARTETRLKVVCVGRLTEKKGIRFLLSAVHRLSTQHSFDVVIIGDGEDAAVLRDFARALGVSHCVQFRGSQSNADVLAELANADIFALPCVVTQSGDRDGIPVVLMEAMAAGLPVVSTSVSGIPELISDNHNGVLVRPRDAGDLAHALERLADSEALRARLGEQGRRTIVERFNIRDSATSLRNLFLGGEPPAGVARTAPAGAGSSLGTP